MVSSSSSNPIGSDSGTTPRHFMVPFIKAEDEDFEEESDDFDEDDFDDDFDDEFEEEEDFEDDLPEELDEEDLNPV